MGKIGGVKAGTILDFGGTLPLGYMECDGAAVSRATYARLFEAIGVRFGIGDGATTFNLPDCRGRVSVGAGTVGPTTRTVAQFGGAETHQLTEAQLPSHTHVQNAHVHTQGVSENYNGSGSTKSLMRYDTASMPAPTLANYSNDTTAVNQSTGGSQAHNNLQPSLVVTKMIKY